jgi:tetratricopeptide (TPR) repeat protein
MTRKIPPLLGLALKILLSAHGWTAKEIAEKAGVGSTTITEYMTREGMLSRERLRELAVLMGLDEPDVEGVILAATLVHPEGPPSRSPVDPTAEEHRVMARAAVRAGLDAAGHVYADLLALVRRGNTSKGLEEGRRLWRQLQPFTGADLRELAEAPIYDRWGLAVILCGESEKAAADKPPRAFELAEVAVGVARRVPGAFGTRLHGSCTGFLANAQRVACELLLSEESFAEAWRLWREGDDEAGLLSEARMLDLEASLRRDQRLFGRAVELHDQAIEAARPEERGHFLLNKGFALQEKGEPEEALQVFALAAEEIDGGRHPRLRFGLQFNRTASLCRLGRAEEAAQLVDEVRELAESLRSDRYLIKTVWLQANVDTGLGRRQQALAGLQQVRRDFEARKDPFDYALASLDLALLYRKEGRFSEIEALAGEMLTIFQALRVGREALSTVILFQESARNKDVSVELIRRLQDDLKARIGPGLPCES